MGRVVLAWTRHDRTSLFTALSLRQIIRCLASIHSFRTSSDVFLHFRLHLLGGSRLDSFPCCLAWFSLLVIIFMLLVANHFRYSSAVSAWITALSTVYFHTEPLRKFDIHSETVSNHGSKEELLSLGWSRFFKRE